MLIPSIDLRGGRIVQLVQGEALALESGDIDGWIDRFRRFDKVQLIDLDAALGAGDNAGLVRRICTELTCRVGGGVRTVDRAKALLDDGATHVIVGSSFFTSHGPNLAAARHFVEAIGSDRVIAAADSRAGQIVVRGWTTGVPLATTDAIRALDPWCAEFLYTHVDTEGLMRGIDMAAVRAVREATTRPISAAGGITTRDEIAALDAIRVDAVVGMALYTGRLALDADTAS